MRLTSTLKGAKLEVYIMKTLENLWYYYQQEAPMKDNEAISETKPSP